MHPDPTRPGPDPDPQPPPAALHLLPRLVDRLLPDCGHELARSRDQEAAERTGERRRCPICRPDDADAPVPSDDGDWITVPRHVIPDHPELQDQLDDWSSGSPPTAASTRSRPDGRLRRPLPRSCSGRPRPR